MTNPVSWWLKFDRAQDHLRVAEGMVAAATVERAIRIEKSQSEGGTWEYTVHHDATIDPAFPAVVGDFLFNLRSALDHIAAFNRLEPTWKTPFPLFHEPIGGPAISGEPKRFRRYRDTWEQVRANTPPAVFKVMNDAQPFNARAGLVPADTALAVLNELQNRDKHASLAVVISGIKDIACWVEVPNGRRPIPDPHLPPGMFPNGANIFSHHQSLDIRCRGRIALSIAAGPTAGNRPLPDSFGDMAGDVEALLTAIDSVM
ncbi:hypothetical protein B7495_06175 [Cryobacterium sp. LW097]|uniref:hypothetical protein n=1 Tax=Cryobacterium sp. LW097 TaxID=1978566 RepID=UPI000B4CA800|nr:hypothetical protein [Cryobacterium sp. LW097]ASD21734.1 hypothetical protein B7495_06175 [Cryobacterium sp. LW097]